MALPPPERQKQIIANAAHRYGIDPSILYGVYGAETNFGANTNTSGAGAVGPFQFEPSTAAARGVNPLNFRSAAFGAAKYLSDYKGRGTAGMLAAYNAGPAGNPNNPETQAYIPKVEQLAQRWNGSVQGDAPQIPQRQTRPGARNVLDQQGFQQAQREFQLGQILQNSKSPFQEFGPKTGLSPQNPLLAILPKTEPQAVDYTKAVTSLAKLSGGLAVKHPLASPKKGIADFSGTKVAAWIAPALEYARQHGWKGSVTSGYRSFADQKRIYDSGVRPAAVPGTSNHEGADFPRGAVDVSDAEQLAAILAKSPYRGKLVWAGAKDPVHFSHPHGGSY